MMAVCAIAGVSPDGWVQAASTVLGLVGAVGIAVVGFLVERKRARTARYIDSAQPILDDAVAAGVRLCHSFVDQLAALRSLPDGNFDERFSAVGSLAGESQRCSRDLLALEQRWSVLGIHGSEANQPAGEVLAAMHEVWSLAHAHQINLSTLLIKCGKPRSVPRDWHGQLEALRVEGHGVWTTFDAMRDCIRAFVRTLDDREPPPGQPSSLADLLAEE